MNMMLSVMLLKAFEIAQAVNQPYYLILPNRKFKELVLNILLSRLLAY